MQERAAHYRGVIDRVNVIVCDLVRRGEGFGDRKAFISDVANKIGIPMKRFGPMLAHMNNLGWVWLARLDLPQGQSPQKVLDSEIEIEGVGARFHLIECQPKKNPTEKTMPVHAHVDLERVEEMRANEAFYRPAAEKVNAAARDLVARGIGFGDKAFVSDVAQALGMTTARLAPLLVNWNNIGWVRLARADLVGAMPPDKVRDSEIVFGRDERGSSFHFIETFDYEAQNEALRAYLGAGRKKRNPSSPSSRAIEKFTEFHDFEPRETGTIPGLKIPSTVKIAGDAVHVMYRSDKWHQGRSDDYIHEHDGGVKVGRTGNCSGPSRTVPAEIQRVSTLVRIGRCLGVAYADDDGNVVEMRPDGSVQLYCSPNGRALFVVDGVRVKNGRATFTRPKVEMILWGGRLGVEDRGIVH
jgi:hypothetical protein